MAITVNRKITTAGRLRKAALYWGLPVAILELIGAPFGIGTFLLAVPIFAVATAIAFGTDAALIKIVDRLETRSK